MTLDQLVALRDIRALAESIGEQAEHLPKIAAFARSIEVLVDHLADTSSFDTVLVSFPESRR